MSADEFEVIGNLFAPLATSAGARGLIDDVAVLEARGKLVVTTDAIVEGVHFLADDPIDTVAKKALRVNLSDLSAKGAKCVGVLLTLVWPDARPSAQIAEFARGLSEDLELYEVALLGGDTTSTPGPLMISITAFGEPLGDRVPSRADAKLGEDVWVTGTIGDGWVGLQALARLSSSESFAGCVSRCRAPAPRVAFASAVAMHASAAMDVSDGLIQDAGKLAAASKLRLRINADDVPISAEVRAWLAQANAAVTDTLAGGDDYEILFTAPQRKRETIAAAARAANTEVARIGAVEAGEGVLLIDHHGAELKITAGGYRHKLGA